MKILVTGGAGYIGSHTCVELLDNNYEVVIIDNLSNSSVEAISRIKELTGKEIDFYEADILDREVLKQIFANHKIEAVIHFAGLKAVGESCEKPIEYYYNNLAGTLVLCDEMRNAGIKNIVFSSSATVYGKPESLPIQETFPLSATNPYGSTKLFVENILSDIYISDNSWNVIILRYFNPIGAHKSGRIGEDPKGIPNNLLPYVAKVAIGELPFVNVHGNDYDTIDGTGVRDYIHVVDLAKGHVKAIEKIITNPGREVYNLGTGNGYSVLQVINSFSKACGKEIPYVIGPRRSGDIDACYADASKARSELSWEPEFEIEKMCEDLWRWQKSNPNGYR